MVTDGKNPSAVIFDLDGTLHDRASGINAFAQDQAQRLRVSIENSTKFVDRFLELDDAGKVWKDVVYSTLCEEFDLAQSAQELTKQYLEKFPNFAIETPGATDVLFTLRAMNFRIGILTNGRADLQRAVVRSLGFIERVDEIIISDEIGYRKPDSRIFEAMVSALGVTKNRAIMVGDDLSADIDGASRYGIRSIAFGHSLTEQCTASTMDEVVTMVKPLLG